MLLNVLLHLGSLWLFINAFSGNLRICLIVAICLSFGMAVYFQSPLTKRWVSVIRFQAKSNLRLQFSDGIFWSVKYFKVVWKSPYLIIVEWKVDGHYFRQAIWFDMCTRWQYHQLYLTLNWLLNDFKRISVDEI